MRKATIERYLNRWGLRVLAVAAVLMIVLFVASLVLIYVGDEYVTPSWSESSVPAPRGY